MSTDNTPDTTTPDTTDTTDIGYEPEPEVAVAAQEANWGACWVAAAIGRTIEAKGVGHFSRPAGSTLTGLDVSDGEAVVGFLRRRSYYFPGELGWEDVTAEVKAAGAALGRCRYYRAHLFGEVKGLERIALLSELGAEDLANVRVVKGHHGGFELQLPGGEPRETDVVHIILGNPDDAALEPGPFSLVYTWYPGRVTPAVPLAKATVKFV